MRSPVQFTAQKRCMTRQTIDAPPTSVPASHTMFTRTLALVACVMMLATAGCGGDEGSSGPACTGTEMSVPGSPKDPCDQTDMTCKAAGGMAYATCENGK